MAQAGKLGGDTIKRKYPKEHFQKIGSLGGTKVRNQRGKEYFKELARKAAVAIKRKKELEKRQLELKDITL